MVRNYSTRPFKAGRRGNNKEQMKNQKRAFTANPPQASRGTWSFPIGGWGYTNDLIGNPPVAKFLVNSPSVSLKDKKRETQRKIMEQERVAVRSENKKDFLEGILSILFFL